MTDADRKREAFAAWDAYRETFEQMVDEIANIPPTDNALTRNPLVGVIYADGYLAGLAKGEERCAALEAATRRVALAWPYYRELTDYVEFEVALDELRAVVSPAPTAGGSE